MNQKWHRWFTVPIQRASADNPWFGPTMSAVLLASLINVLTSSLFEAGAWLAWSFVAVLAAAAIVFVLYYNRRYNRWIRNLGPIADIDPPPQYPGLIVLYSRKETALAALEHHSPALKHCWLIVTPEMQASAGETIAQFPAVRFSALSISNLYNAQACYEIVRHIYQQGVGNMGLRPEQVIADITGGTKPMTMGMIVACLEGGFAIEHVPTKYDSNGNPQGPLPPIEIRVQKN